MRAVDAVRSRAPAAALVVPVAVVHVGGTLLASLHQPERRSIDALALLLLLAGPAALAFRRRYPATVLYVVFASTLAYWVIGYPRGPVFLPLVVAFVGAVMAGRRRAAWGSLVLGWLSFSWLGYLLGREKGPSWLAVAGLAAWLLVLATAGDVARTRRDRAAASARAREEEARRRASEERVRIARELHDVLAHDISLINVQAGVALHLIDERPEQARTALANIKQASKDALGELRSVLEVLRQVDEDLPRSPTAGLDGLHGLVSRAAAAGIEVRLEVDGPARPLPPGVDLAAFRIVQEALTNVTRHAGPATATVRVTYGDDDLVVQVDDDGAGGPSPAVAAPAAGGGNGIRGMRERAAALGGRLDAGPRPGGGFRVRSWLPVRGAS
jgi:signal transduction histidine kinase